MSSSRSGADLSIEAVGGSGTVNRIFRLGDRLSARFPLVVDDPDAVLDYLQSEAAAAKEISGRTRFLTPEPVALGRATPDYPAPWAVHTWLPGTPAADVDLSGSKVLVRDVAQLIVDVRAIPLCGRSFRGHGRGGDLRLHDGWMETCFTESEGLLEVAPLRSLWSQMRELPRVDGDIMTHGDILPSNLLVDDDALVGVLDVGNLGPADPALDLMGAWSLFDHERRQLLRSDSRVQRSRVGARAGVGISAGDGHRLVLPREQSDHEPAGSTST